MSYLFLNPQLHVLGLLSGRASSLCLRSVYPTSIPVVWWKLLPGRETLGSFALSSKKQEVIICPKQTNSQTAGFTFSPKLQSQEVSVWAEDKAPQAKNPVPTLFPLVEQTTVIILQPGLAGSLEVRNARTMCRCRAESSSPDGIHSHMGLLFPWHQQNHFHYSWNWKRNNLPHAVLLSFTKREERNEPLSEGCCMLCLAPASPLSFHLNSCNISVK